MFEPLKLLTLKTKAILIGIIFAIMLTAVVSTGFIYYNKGVNQAKVELQKFEKKKARVETKLVTKAAEVDTKVVIKYIKKVEQVDKVVEKNIEVIKLVPYRFNLSKGWLYTYNQSVLGLEVDPVLASDSTESLVADNEALKIITENNGIFFKVKAQADALIEFTKEREALYESINKE